MDNATQGSDRRSSNNRGGRNNNRNRKRNNRSRNRNRNRKPAPKKKQNPVLAFFSKLFGLESKPQKGNQRKGSTQKKKNHTPKPAEEQPQVTSARLYIGNLSYDTTESDLFDHFGTVGQVKNAEIVRDRNERSKGFGFVEMNSVEMAQTASEKFHRTEYMGRQIIVAGAKN